MMTVSAVARLMPSPPARVDSRKAKSLEPGALKCSIACKQGVLLAGPAEISVPGYRRINQPTSTLASTVNMRLKARKQAADAQHLVAGLCRGRAIQPLVLEASQPHVVAHDVQHPDHLAEDEHPAQQWKAVIIGQSCLASQPEQNLHPKTLSWRTFSNAIAFGQDTLQ